ncbi:MAG: hypothetical protein ACKVT1_20480 [Dehalococcoidia bacterium]
MEDGDDGYPPDDAAPNARSHAFVVRLWIEETGRRGGTTWRGHITHVASQEKRYLREIDDLVLFVMPYLQRVGVRFNRCWRARQWRQGLKR